MVTAIYIALTLTRAVGATMWGRNVHAVYTEILCHLLETLSLLGLGLRGSLGTNASMDAETLQ